MKRILILLFACLTTIGSMAGSSDLNRFIAEYGREWKILRARDGAIRTMFGKSIQTYPSPAAAATEFIADYHSLFGIEDVSSLRLQEVEIWDYGTDYIYRQYYSGLPVVGGVVSIHMDRANRMIGATSEYKKGLKGRVGAPKAAGPALRTAESFVGSGKADPIADLMILSFADRTPKPVWRVDVNSTTLSEGSWQMYVDALHPNVVLSGHATHIDFEGTGNVWQQNPVVTPDRTLEKLKNMDSSKKLFGKFVRVYNADSNQEVFNFPIDVSALPTASDPNRNYDYEEKDSRLTEAMAYFHINEASENWRSFGFRKLNAKLPVFVNAPDPDRNRGFDNAFFTRSTQFKKTGMLVFGAGFLLENFGLDSDVYYHEYGHAVLDKIKPDFLSATENNYPRAFHEGFGDIASAAITKNPKLAEFALRLRRTGKFLGRNLDNNNRFPEDVIHRRTKRAEVHHAGLIVGGAWWDLQLEIGASDAQRILYNSLRFLPRSEMTFFDLRDAMLAADANTFSGSHQTAINNAFVAHGIAGEDPGQQGTVTANGLRTALWNLQTGRVKLQNTFKKGDRIMVFLEYETSSDLIPGYNLIASETKLSGPSTDGILHFQRRDEARKGKFEKLRGAAQVSILTENAVPGAYAIAVRSRLGGSNQLTDEVSTNFVVLE